MRRPALRGLVGDPRLRRVALVSFVLGLLTVSDSFLYLLLRDNPSLFNRQARIMPSVRDGALHGLKFYAIRPGSLPRANISSV